MKMLSILFFYCLLSYILCIYAINSNIINKEVIRTIDATESIVRIQTEIKAMNIMNKEYQLIFPNNIINNLAFISVNMKGNTKTQMNSILPLSAPIR